MATNVANMNNFGTGNRQMACSFYT